MYGALIALIFINLAATNGFIWLIEKYPARKVLLKRITITLIAAGAVAIITQRAITATPHRIRAAALFLEQYDSSGPFQITSSKWRTKIQGYVSGCPRFKITKTGPVKAHIQRPPSFKVSTPRIRPSAPLRDRITQSSQTLAAWTSYSRHIITVSGLSVSYYGENPRRYIFTITPEEPAPANTIKIYDKDDVKIFKPIKQHIPANTCPQRACPVGTEDFLFKTAIFDKSYSPTAQGHGGLTKGSEENKK